MSETINLKALAEPFPADAIGWKPQSINGARALAIAYIDARDVMDRLDAVAGVADWQDSYTALPDGNVICRLSLRIGGEWISKEDVGSESEQKDEGDRRKAAFSDALKRAAIKWGIGRYLYRLPAQWVDYDPQKKQLRGTPSLPDWALPRSAAPARTKPAATKPDDPETGVQLIERVELLDDWAAQQKLCSVGEVRKAWQAEIKANRWPDDVTTWDAAQVRLGMSEARHIVKQMQERKKGKPAA